MTLAAVLERSRREKEQWRYTDLSALLARPAAARAAANVALASPSPQHQRLVFVNGAYQAEMSNFGQLAHDLLQGDAANGYRLTLAAQTCLVTAPIELVFVTDGDAPQTATQFDIRIGASDSLTLIERHCGNRTAATQVMEVSIGLAAQAKLVHHKILTHHHGAAHLARTAVRVADGAYYRNFALIKDARLVRNEIEVTLDGALAQCALDGVMLLRELEHADTFTRIVHAAPHGTSRQLYKTILADRAHGVFQGKIIVEAGAQKTDGKQLSRALLLSDQAEMDAKPELEIYADDVACSHGSTVGDLDADALFYLRARGLTEDEARALLLRAFVSDVLDGLPSTDEREAALAEAGRWFDDLR